MNLVIVESPAKAKTIEGFLGKDFVVRSSYGHVRDLSGKGMAIDIENGFVPNYEVLPDKSKIITELKKLAKKSDIVWLATDEDREGEAISWHLNEVLNLEPSKTKRIVFNEITKSAITKAIENPRTIDNNLVDAQQARRVLDRLVGFELSPILWKKVKPSLSAGRVQSVTVRLIVEREREVDAFEAQSSYRVVALFDVDGSTLKAELAKRLKTKEEAQEFLEKCKTAKFKIENLETKPSKRKPAAPFTTSTLQQEASRKLGFSVNQTMVVAQRLYEAGKITYMRTDSVNLSDLAVNMAKQVITNEYGAEYSQVRKYSSKSKGAQEAHEAIRPTYIENSEVDGDNGTQRLYDLIWKRTVASQMADAELEKTTVTISVSGSDLNFQAKGEVIKFEGFLKVYLESTDDENDEDDDSGLLPPLKIGQELENKEVKATERFTHHPPRYTEASLVRKLEELGIGRPSTYAPTISTVQKRGYVVKEDREGTERKYHELVLEKGALKDETKTEVTGREKNKLFPTDIGIVVNDFLVDHFERILDYNFTASVEKEFDDIAHGQLEWNKMIDRFYGPFHENVEVTLENSERATGERVLGEDPKTGKPIVARIGRYGPMVQIGSAEDEEKPKFAGLRKDQSINSITLEEALDLFKLPRDLGEYEGKPVSANVGRFGPYVRHGNMFVSLKVKEGDDPMSVTLDRAIVLIEEKKEADKNKYIKTFDEDESVQVLNGRYGPYIKIGRKNFKIPKDVKPEELTLEQCKEIAENQPTKKTGGTRKKKTTKKK
ncbi:MAG: DNA topoisomerase I [Crocinitomicaceae bacterium]|nr:DNA topoisomerase I [Crocinitomicaceae bacterium]|tara:strand:+ start:1831 stop:4158 length:2328 start_codon:yes stop_codon:yes gene_type:complete